MMQAAENRLTGHGARVSRLDRPRLQSVLVQPEVCLRLVVVGEVCAQHPVLPNNSIGQQIAPIGTADRRFATVTEAHLFRLGAISCRME